MQGSARKDVVFGAALVYAFTVPGPKWKSWCGSPWAFMRKFASRNSRSWTARGSGTCASNARRQSLAFCCRLKFNLIEEIYRASVQTAEPHRIPVPRNPDG